MNNYTDDVKLKKLDIKVWRSIIKIILTSKKTAIWLIVTAGLIALVDSILPVMNAYGIETFVENQNMEMLVPYIIGNIILAFVFGFLVWAFIKLAGIVEADVSYELRKQAFKTLQELSFSFYDKTPQGQIMAVMTSDARRLSQIISWGILDFVWSFFLMVFTLVILFFYNWQLALIALASLPIMLIISIIFRKQILIQYRKARKYNSQLTAQFNEGVIGAKTTKSLVIEKLNFDEYSNTANQMRKHSLRAVKRSAIYHTVLLSFLYIMIAYTMFTGSNMVLTGSTITIATLYLFIRSMMGLFDPIMVISNTLAQVQQAQASAERVLSLIETKREVVDSDEVISKYGTLTEHKRDNWEQIKGDITFSNVTFYYNDNEVVLKDFNLEIKAGEQVAIVGHTGSGKTTLVSLLERFYEPVSGQILIDNSDYRNRSLAWLHKNVSYVMQMPHLFSTTVMENIRYGRLDATDEEVIAASKSIGIHDLILKLENGYDTFVGEGGGLLSIGEKQLIAFARAVLADPKILILDEATSSIDSIQEQLIQKATKTLLKGRTSIIIAHRLSTIVDADKIIVMRDGKIVESGTHHELLAKQGYYSELYLGQFVQTATGKLIK